MFADIPPETQDAPAENLLVELDIPSEMILIPMVVDLGISLMEIRGYLEQDLQAVKLAIHETLVNAIQYGNRGNPSARVHIKFYIKDDCFYTDIDDEGTGFEIDALSDPTQPENILKPSGRGIFLVRNLTEDFKVTKLPNKGVRVTFCRLKKK